MALLVAGCSASQMSTRMSLGIPKGPAEEMGKGGKGGEASLGVMLLGRSDLPGIGHHCPTFSQRRSEVGRCLYGRGSERLDGAYPRWVVVGCGGQGLSAPQTPSLTPTLSPALVLSLTLTLALTLTLTLSLILTLTRLCP